MRRDSTASSIFSSMPGSMASASAARRGSTRISKPTSARPSSAARPSVCRPTARSSSGSGRRLRGARSSSARRPSPPAAARCSLPMPMFFRYEQDDLRAFAAHVSRRAHARRACSTICPISPTASRRRRCWRSSRDEEFIVGIKDSSGREENLTTFAGARQGRGWTLLVGDDRLLHAGLQAGMGRRHFRRGRMLSRAAGRAGPELSGRARRRNRKAPVAPRRAHRSLERVSDAVGHPHRARGARDSDRAAAAAAHGRRGGNRSRSSSRGFAGGSRIRGFRSNFRTVWNDPRTLSAFIECSRGPTPARSRAATSRRARGRRALWLQPPQSFERERCD